MPIKGELLIGRSARRGTNGEIFGLDAASGEKLQPGFGGATLDDLEEAAALASAASRPYRETSLDVRAKFLETIAQNILDIGDELIERCVLESGLPRGRIEGERGRTVGQLRLFADVVRDGGFIGARIDPALPDRKPLPRPDIRQRSIALGPVAVFGASNFPLAFSVAGGDTASALAAGCPVVVKAHDAHPGTSELVGRAITEAVADAGLPAGTFSLLFGSGPELGIALVTDPRIKAVGFTGSRGAGTALVAAAAGRPEPIPVYAEMSSINPVFLLDGALATRGADLGRAFVASLTMGSGQFCTNPGLVIAIDGPGLDGFLTAARDAVADASATPMLTPGIAANYATGVDTLSGEADLIVRGKTGDGQTTCRAALFATGAASFLSSENLQAEVFGASSLVVRCADADEMRTVASNIEGQLTATVHADESDYDDAGRLLPLLELKAGRILFDGWPTGVEVCHAMVHGGPYPATSDSRSTSVGSRAIERFLRPVCYQNVPKPLLPSAIAEDNPDHLWRRIDGRLTQD